MARHFFDFHNGEIHRDETGHKCNGPEEAALEAMRSLPAIAKDRVPQDGSMQAFTIAVRDEVGPTVYTPTLTLAGIWLGEGMPSAR